MKSINKQLVVLMAFISGISISVNAVRYTAPTAQPQPTAQTLSDIERVNRDLAQKPDIFVLMGIPKTGDVEKDDALVFQWIVNSHPLTIAKTVNNEAATPEGRARLEIIYARAGVNNKDDYLAQILENWDTKIGPAFVEFLNQKTINQLLELPADASKSAIDTKYAQDKKVYEQVINNRNTDQEKIYSDFTALFLAVLESKYDQVPSDNFVSYVTSKIKGWFGY